MAIPEFIENVFKWLPADCHDQRWCKEWKTREQKKDETQRKLDEDYYDACYIQDWDEAKRLFDLGATNDFSSDNEQGSFGLIIGGLTPFIFVYAYERKEMCYELIHEYERSTKVLSTLQNHYSETIRTKLELISGTEKWMAIWKQAELMKDLDQLVKNAALWITCFAEDWELAAKWIDRGATNNFVDIWREAPRYTGLRIEEVRKLFKKYLTDLEKK